VLRRCLLVLGTLLALAAGSVTPAAAAPPPLPQDVCQTYAYPKRLSATRLRLSGGVKCAKDRLIAVGITVVRDRKVLFAKGYSWSDGACSYRQCSLGYTAYDPPGRQKFTVLVQSSMAYPSAVGGGPPWKGSSGSYQLTELVTYYQ
jgi:hypothetical protein